LLDGALRESTACSIIFAVGFTPNALRLTPNVKGGVDYV
jgi:hypothetical protein